MGSGKSFFASSIGKKYLMATTGAMLVGFVIVHLLGNLQLFAGPDKFNGYAALLKSIPQFLWPARIGLLLVFLVHIVTAFQLRSMNAAARPAAYQFQNTVQATLASRTMVLSGCFILFYVIGHLLHFTWGVLLPENFHHTDLLGRHDVYSMVVLGFKQPIVSALYIIAMCILGVHLSHGIASIFQTIGIRSPRVAAVLDRASIALAWLIVVGYISIPIGVLAGIIQLPVGGGL